MNMANPKRRPAGLGAVCCLSYCVTLIVGFSVELRTAQAQDSVSASSDELFTLEVLPILKEKCFGCHGTDPDDLRGDYDLMSRDAMIRGGESGEAAVIPGDAENSIFYQAVMWDGYEMPPKENDRLTDEQTAIIKRWIDEGAVWPNEEVQRKIQRAQWSVKETDDGVIVNTSGGLAEDWTFRRYSPDELWAFQPLAEMSPPKQSDNSASDNPIDHFLNQRINEAGLKRAKTADPEILLRRMTLDVTGLLPTEEQHRDFAEQYATNPDKAISTLADQLLSSKHYGERAAQHWLDVVRYSDTAGFSNDYERSNAWRYRDYVIRSFNDDKPFNDFIVEQIAGDELRPDDPECMIATGMLRMGPWGTAMIPQDEARQTFLDDLVHNVGQAFLAMPMRCCKCHDHKFDPIPTQDYYAMYAAFATTQPAEIDVPFLDTENLNYFDENRALTRELLDYAKAELAKVNKKQEDAARAWYEEHDLPYKNENARKNDPEEEKPPRHVGLSPEETGIKKVREQDVWIWERRLERYKPMAQAVYAGHDVYRNSRKLRKPDQIKQEWRPESFVLTGGSLEAKGEKVQPGVLSALAINMDGSADESDSQPWRLTEDLHGRRLELAQWISRDDNPITARCIVNRIWQQHFGVGLVKTSNNFGVKGARPTHPELLDWLTQEFVSSGWKVKPLRRMILNSHAYRMSTRPSDIQKSAEVDPENRLLSHFPVRRLTAEEMRDTMLQISGELNDEMGGVPIMPEINMEVALQPRMIQFSIAPAHQPSQTPQQRNRRSIYTYRVRGQADPFLEILNLPNPNESCQMRDAMAVTPQAFTLMNSDVMTDRSLAIAGRIENERGDDAAKCVHRAFELILGRSPTSEQQSRLTEYLLDMREYHQDKKPKPIEYPTSVTRSLVEEFTGEPFEFIEKLNVFEDYVPDAKPWTVSADIRALADVCLLLLNSNEFMYVY
ncbi:MAG: PSD1 and planctomycete cytochrome C domain-containing protein [Aureliella sp.]